MIKNTWLRIISITVNLSLVIALTSCIETIVVSSTIGAGLAYREKSFADTREDIKIASKIGIKFFANGLKTPSNSIDITVNEGRVMLTGIIRDPAKAKLAQDLCWQVKGVNEVIDEVQIRKDDKLDFGDTASALVDYKITAEIESRFAIAKNIKTINYSITTVDRIVYLLGVASDDSELKKAIDLASRINGVKKVINHVVLANDSRRSR